ncbi:SDR family oxidoreductase [Lacihabitans sp. LS3-19]|uniref:SDR family oxidoreductase n=1 Tax=Lacihabitans sp. LS3-19 TaxID=2487335 RepID=UPI0020CEC779|nr:SDR family oxidoreductase [Lacihabitans sp. LS3-19]MCP9770686.1 SDR family oxidoreductase [Lacihabitans sp. LS3-19]
MKNKVGFITGGSKGIGLGIAEAMVKENIKVAITGRTAETVNEATGYLNKIKADSAIGFVSDVRKITDLEGNIKETEAKWGSVDYLIANAGVGHFGNIETLTADQWNETIDINLTGVFNTVKAALDQIIASKGYIITIASLAGTNFFASGTAYNASKFGLVGFSQALMLDVRSKGVKVTTIMPGSVTSYFNGHEPNEKDAWKIQPEDIGQMVMDLIKMPARTLPSKVEVRPTMPG